MVKSFLNESWEGKESVVEIIYLYRSWRKYDLFEKFKRIIMMWLDYRI